MSKLLIDDKPVMVLPNLAVAVGLNEAIILQQIHYWLETFKTAKKKEHLQNGRWWVYNTLENWQENFPWWKSKRTIQRALNSLRDYGLVLVDRFNKKGYDRTLWYTIDYDALSELEANMTICHNGNGQIVMLDNDNLSSPIPETNTETSTDQGLEKFNHLFGESTPSEKSPDWSDSTVRDAAILAATRTYLSKSVNMTDQTFDWIKSRDGIMADTLRRVAAVFVRAGFAEPQSDKIRKQWQAALAALYQESGGDFQILKKAGGAIMKEELKFWPPHRWVEMIATIKAAPRQRPPPEGDGRVRQRTLV